MLINLQTKLGIPRADETKTAPKTGRTQIITTHSTITRSDDVRCVTSEETLHWSFLGDVIEPPSVECGNCGVLLDESTTACPHCGEELSRDEKV